MEKHFYAWAFFYSVIILLPACGTKSMKANDGKSIEKAAATGEKSTAIETPASMDSKELSDQKNVLECNGLIQKSAGSCSLNNEVPVIKNLRIDQPSLVTFSYVLKCVDHSEGKTSGLALRSDAQMRRLQHNVNETQISIFSKGNEPIQLIFADIAEQPSSSSTPSGCLFLTLAHVKTEIFAESN